MNLSRYTRQLIAFGVTLSGIFMVASFPARADVLTNFFTNTITLTGDISHFFSLGTTNKLSGVCFAIDGVAGGNLINGRPDSEGLGPDPSASEPNNPAIQKGGNTTIKHPSGFNQRRIISAFNPNLNNGTIFVGLDLPGGTGSAANPNFTDAFTVNGDVRGGIIRPFDADGNGEPESIGLKADGSRLRNCMSFAAGDPVPDIIDCRLSPADGFSDDASDGEESYSVTIIFGTNSSFITAPSVSVRYVEDLASFTPNFGQARMEVSMRNVNPITPFGAAISTSTMGNGNGDPLSFDVEFMITNVNAAVTNECLRLQHNIRAISGSNHDAGNGEDQTALFCYYDVPPVLTLTASCPATNTPPGGTEVLTVTVCNTGPISVTNIVVTHVALGIGSQSFTIPRLGPTNCFTTTFSIMVPPAYPFDFITNTLTASGTSVCGTNVSTNLTINCPVPPCAPAILVANFNCATPLVPPGGSAVFTGMVCNVGNITLINVTVTNRLLSPPNNVVLGPITLLTNQGLNCASFAFTNPVPASGVITGAVCAIGTAASPCPPINVTACASSICCMPGIVVTNFLCATPTVGPGGVAMFTGQVCNVGKVTLTSVILDIIDPLSPPMVIGTLLPNQCSGTFSIPVLVPASGVATATVCAIGTDPCGNIVTNCATNCCCPIGIVVTNFLCATPQVGLGGVAMFTGQVCNVGKVTLTNVVLDVVDPFSPAMFIGTLLPNQCSPTFSIAKFVTDLPVCSTVFAFGTGPGPCCNITVTNFATNCCCNPGILVANFNCATLQVTPGGTAVFTGQVCNVGNVLLTNVTLTSIDPLQPQMLIGMLPTNQCSPTFSISVTVPASGMVTNTVRAIGTAASAACPPNTMVTNTATTNCQPRCFPGILVANFNCATPQVPPGGTAVFTGQVCNVGNVPLTDVTLTSLDPLQPPMPIGPLATNQCSPTFSISVTVPASGMVTSTVRAVGTAASAVCPPGTMVTNTATAMCTNCPACLQCIKNCAPNPCVPGQQFRYVATVTNCGEVLLTNIAVLTVRDSQTNFFTGEFSLQPHQATNVNISFNCPNNVVCDSVADILIVCFTPACPAPNNFERHCTNSTQVPLCNPPRNNPKIAVTKNCTIEVVNVPNNTTTTQGNPASTTTTDAANAPNVAVAADHNPDNSSSSTVSTVSNNADTTTGAGAQVVTVRFSGTVMNMGDVRLVNVFVVDDQPQPNTPVLGPITLDPGESRNFSGSFQVNVGATANPDQTTSAAADNSSSGGTQTTTQPGNDQTTTQTTTQGNQVQASFMDTVTARGTSICGSNVMATATATCCPAPKIAVTKNCSIQAVNAGTTTSASANAAVAADNGDNSSSTSSTTTTVGPQVVTVQFSGTVMNMGSVRLVNVTVVDDHPAPNTRVLGPITLDPGESRAFSGSFQVDLGAQNVNVQADGGQSSSTQSTTTQVNPAQSIMDTVTARGTSVCGQNAMATAMATCCAEAAANTTTGSSSSQAHAMVITSFRQLADHGGGGGNNGGGDDNNSETSISGGEGCVVDIEGSSDLTSWMKLARVLNTGGLIRFNDPGQATNLCTFFRAVMGTEASAPKNFATLTAVVNPKGVDTVVHFELGLTTNYGNATMDQHIGSGILGVPVANLLSGLTVGQIYHYRWVAVSATETNFGPDSLLPIPAAANPGGALNLDGLNDFVLVPDGPSLDITGLITVEAWIFRSATGVQHSIVEKYGCAGAAPAVGGYALRVNASDKLVFLTEDNCNSGVAVIGATSLQSNTWYHVAGVWDGAQLQVYVNGLLDGAVATAHNPQPGNTPLVIGARGNDFATPFAGSMDEVRLWNVARTAADLQATMNRSLTGAESGLAGYWRFDDGVDLTAKDSTANGDNGILVNGPIWVTSTAQVQGVAAITLAPGNVTASSATLNGSANPSGATTFGFFEWGSDTTYGNTTPVQNLGSGSGSVAVFQTITGLTANQTSHYRFVAVNANGVAYGADVSFNTLAVVSAAPPSATTLPASGATISGATLKGSANPNGSATAVYFQWGLSDSYGNVTAVQTIGEGVSNLTVSSPLSGLFPSATYHYRAAATNAGGMAFGADETFITKALPTAIIFDGTNDAVVVPDSASVRITGPITVEAWVFRTTIGVQHSIMEKYGCIGTAPAVGGYTFRINASDKLVFRTEDDCNNGTSGIGATSLRSNTWYHVAGVWDGTQIRVYVNGVLDGSVATTRNPKAGNTPLRIGARGNDSATPIAGLIDEVRLWNVARTAADLQANMGHTLTGSENGMAGYWRFDEGAGTTAKDTSANHNDGTLVNGPTWGVSLAPITPAP